RPRPPGRTRDFRAADGESRAWHGMVAEPEPSHKRGAGVLEPALPRGGPDLMKRTITTTFAAVAVLALAAAGCEKKDENKAGGASGAAGAAAAVPSKTGFAVFPADSKVIVGINVASARSSALW